MRTITQQSDQENISRAKREWESTADALPQLICLMNEQARVIRGNRTIERWMLGSVKEALGKSLHGLLHPLCMDSRCTLQEKLIAGWAQLQDRHLSEFEVIDEQLHKTLHIELITAAPSGVAVEPITAYAICVVSDITELKDAQRQLLQANQELEERIRERTQDLLKTNEALQQEVIQRQQAELSLLESRDGLSKLSVELMEAQETERKRIARDLHDTIGQSLSAIKYSLERAILLQRSPMPSDNSKALSVAVEQVQRTLKEVRLISMNLRPSLLDDLGAVSAISWLCREWGEIYNTVSVTTDFSIVDEDVPDAISTALFRSVQECLNNVARHSQARCVLVKLRVDATRLLVEVADDGVGFDPEDVQRGFSGGHGLPGIRERAERAGGYLKCVSRPGGGVFLQIVWPLTPPVIQQSSVASCIHMQ